MDDRGGEEFYLHRAEPSVDVHGIAGGSPRLIKTVLPVHAEANVSIRLVHDQGPGRDRRNLPTPTPRPRRPAPSLRSRSPRRTRLLVDPDSPAVQFGLDAFEHVAGRRLLLVRSGGPILVAALSERGIPTLVTGFSLPDSNIHSPNERLPAEYLPLGVDTAVELFRRLGTLPRE